MDIIDTHAHLSDLHDIEGVIKRAKKAGVSSIIAVGANQKTNIETLKWTDGHPGYIYPALGIHPTEWSGNSVDVMIEFILKNIHRCVAVGEIGLDYWSGDAGKNEEIRSQQRDIYMKMLEIAREKSKPTSVHGRGAWRDALKLAATHGPELIVFHWYSGPLEVLTELLDRGYYVSATPAIEYSRDHKAALMEVPLERIVIETDSPVYMRNRGRSSEPADVVITLRSLAKLKDVDEEEVARITTKNAKKIFKI